MAYIKKGNNGGARPGAGRKKGKKIGPVGPYKTEEDRKDRHTIYLNAEQWEKFRLQGGSDTLRYMLDNGLFKAEIQNNDTKNHN